METVFGVQGFTVTLMTVKVIVSIRATQKPIVENIIPTAMRLILILLVKQ